MKHTLTMTLLLISLFIVSQIVGLVTISRTITVETMPTGEIVLKKADTFMGPQPELPDKEKSYSFIPLIIVVLLGTGILLLLIKVGWTSIWKYWFLLAVFITLVLSFDVWVSRIFALALALILSLIKVFKPNMYVHNLTEIFIYTGIAIIILPFLNIYSGFGILVLISIYDMYAVWKSKHMVKLAEFQLNSKLFAGLAISYGGKKPKNLDKGTAGTKVVVKSKNAILGGGDIVFPLLFSSVVMELLVKSWGFSKITALFSVFIITLTTAIALVSLLLFSKKDRYYPAMPFVSAGCFAGFLIVWVVSLI